jgi:small-conductance mechanosensitive channel
VTAPLVHLVRSELAVAVRPALAAACIEIAFPQRDIHIRSAHGEPLDLRRREQRT